MPDKNLWQALTHIAMLIRNYPNVLRHCIEKKTGLSFIEISKQNSIYSKKKVSLQDNLTYAHS